MEKSYFVPENYKANASNDASFRAGNDYPLLEKDYFPQWGCLCKLESIVQSPLLFGQQAVDVWRDE